MKEWINSCGILRATKEIELERLIYRDGRIEWNLNICAYGEWWDESYNRKLDAYRSLKERWGISWSFWRQLCDDVITICETNRGWEVR